MRVSASTAILQTETYSSVAGYHPVVGRHVGPIACRLEIEGQIGEMLGRPRCPHAGSGFLARPCVVSKLRVLAIAILGNLTPIGRLRDLGLPYLTFHY
jgi:hypothetical protein